MSHLSDDPLRTKGVFLRMNRHIYPELLAHLGPVHGFEDVCLLPDDRNPQTRMGRTLYTLVGLVALWRVWPKLRRADVIVSAPKNFSYIVRGLMRLGLLRPKLHVAWAYFVQSPQMMKLYRKMSVLDSDRDVYAVFSHREAEIYSQALNVPLHRFQVLRYGDWKPDMPPLPVSVSERGDYFFAGGYSNRDHAGLIEVFRQLPDLKLVIACSSSNLDFLPACLPENVKILRDVPMVEFEALVARAVACLIAVRDPEGAAGQAVVVHGLRHGTPVIVSDTPFVREYIQSGHNGHLVADLTELARQVTQMADLIRERPEAYQAMCLAAHGAYVNTFSYQSQARDMNQMLKQRLDPIQGSSGRAL